MKTKERLCPYNLHVVQQNQDTHEYNENGQEVFHVHRLAEVQKPSPCAGKACGAWRFGHCRRKG